ncbi:HSP 20, partial [Gracilaria domingensis]
MRKSNPTPTELVPAARTHQLDEKHTVLQLDLPRVDKEHVSVQVHAHKLTVTGKRLRFANHSAENTHEQPSDGNVAIEDHNSVIYNTTFALARVVHVEAVKAKSFQNGVLS